MLEIFGTEYYIDVDAVIEKCRLSYTDKKEEPKIVDPESNDPDTSDGGMELNIFKFEVYKACIERVLGEYEEADEDIGVFGGKSSSPSFKIAFNTLLKYEILIEG